MRFLGIWGFSFMFVMVLKVILYLILNLETQSLLEEISAPILGTLTGAIIGHFLEKSREIRR